MKKYIQAMVLLGLATVAQAQSKKDKYDEGYAPPQKEIEWCMQFDGISGPGRPVQGDGRGGWRSSADGVKYQGPNPKSVYEVSNKLCDGSAVTKGVLPNIRPAWELHLRDGVVTLGGDGNYYLTGSSGDNIWAYAKGIELWRSRDLKTWDYLGLVWDIDRDAENWVRKWRNYGNKHAVRAVWAPEIHYMKGNYFICFSMCPGGVGILKSATGKPEGPYVNAFTEHGPIVSGIDPTLFEDEDGTPYFTWSGGGQIARLKDDMSGFAEKFRRVEFVDYDTIPSHHADKCVKRGMKDLGHEGVVLFKHNGKYYLGAADTYEGRYSTCLAVSDNIYGPYKMRHEAVPCAGGTGFFKDRDGKWWESIFGNDGQSPFREKIGFVRVDFDKDGRVIVAKDQPFAIK